MTAQSKAKRGRGRPRKSENEFACGTSISLLPKDKTIALQHMADDSVSSFSAYITQLIQADHERRIAETEVVKVTRTTAEYRAEMVSLGEQMAQILWTRQELTMDKQRELASYAAAIFNVPMSYVIADGMEQARLWLARWKGQQKVFLK